MFGVAEERRKMNKKPFYAWEKFGVAVHSLVTDHGEIKARLLAAFLSISSLSSRDIPDEIQDQFAELRGLLTAKEPNGDEGRVRATLRYMRMDKASEIAERFLNIYLRLTEICKED